MSWGLDSIVRSKKRKHINARIETADTRPLFRRAYRRGRCLIPATGYYEWYDAGEPPEAKERSQASSKKKAYYAQDKAGQLLLMAGLYEKTAAGVFGFVVVTQPSSGAAAQYHDRMPLLVREDLRQLWLEDPEARTQLQAATPELHWTQLDPKRG